MKKLFSLILVAALLCVGFASCGKTQTETKVLKVAATSAPHAEILEQCKPLMAEKGYDLQITVVDDYVSRTRRPRTAKSMQTTSSTPLT